MAAKKEDDIQNRVHAERVNAMLARGKFERFDFIYPKFFEAALQMWRQRGGDLAVVSVSLWYDENEAMWLEPSVVAA